ncbi:unnamed protein product [Effrenium voratum]|nr:unnamed protein product [Effrenium voratum]|mmetsp:Transcript_121025/g.287507  ORF Transcript_121025/g.287507 Transcript_121025/m.287507 type:complete len:209 (+) Transcript_121025:56-682(+)
MVVLSEKVREAFRSWDVRGNGTIGRRQLICILRRLTPQVSEADLEVLFVAAGVDAETGVSYNDFISYLWSDHRTGEHLWDESMKAARAKVHPWPAERVDRYWNEVEHRLQSQQYIDHVKSTIFVRADKDHDGTVSFEEAKTLISQSLQCAADLTRAPRPTQEEVRRAFDAHLQGQGQRLSEDEFVDLARHLQVIVAQAMLPFSKVVTE